MSFLGKFDGEARFKGDSGEIDHAASARENLDAAGRDLRMLAPDKTAEAIKMIAEAGAIRTLGDMGYDISNDPNPYALLFKGLLKLPVGIVRDAAELAIAPLLAAKDVTDAAAHGIAASIRGARIGR